MSAPLPSRTTRPRFYYGWVIVASLFTINVAVHTSGMFSFGVFLVPMSEELGVSRGGLGLGITARMLASGLTSIVIGRLLDRHGARLLIPVAATVGGVALIGMNWVDSLWQFVALFTLVGLSGVTAPNNLLTSVPIAKWFVRKRARATAFAAAGLGIGGALFAPVHQVLIDSLGWRTTWVISGVLLMAVLVPIGLLFIRRQPEDMGLQPDGDQVQAAAGAAADQPHALETNWTVREAVQTATLWKVLLVYMLIAFAQGGYIAHRIAFWEDRGFGRALITSSFALDAIIFFLSILTAGFILGRYPIRYVGVVAITCQIAGITTALLSSTTGALFLSAVATGLGAGTAMVIQVHIWPTYFGRAFVGSIRGIVLPTTLVGQALGAPVYGFAWAAAGESYLPIFWASSVLMVFAALLLASSRPPHKSAHQSDTLPYSPS